MREYPVQPPGLVPVAGAEQAIAAGASSSRPIVTSTRIAEAMPTPTIFTMALGSRAKPAATATMIAAAAVMILDGEQHDGRPCCDGHGPGQPEQGGSGPGLEG